MANAFSKEEKVMFENMLEGFNDALVMVHNVTKYTLPPLVLERAHLDRIWRTMPYIARTFSGADQTGNFFGYEQLAVPATVSTRRVAPWTMSDLDIRDALQEGNLGKAARNRLASDINLALLDVASEQGTLVARVAGATGFADIAECDTLFNEIGVPGTERYIAMSSRDYNAIAANLAVRTTVTGPVKTAYERAYVANVASFDLYKLDYATRLPAAAANTRTIDTTTGGPNRYTPTARTPDGNLNRDNRSQTVTLSAGTSNFALGDCLTIAGVNSCHMLSKRSTGRLKTFRVRAASTGTSLIISPPIIAAGPYQNVVIDGAGSATAAISLINNAAANVNPFWHKDAIEFLSGSLGVSGAGTDTLRGTIDGGIEVVMQKQYNIRTAMTEFRTDVLYGVVNKQPEMTGILLFGQTL